MAQQFTETERAILRIVQADLPDSLTVYPGHDYGERPHDTLGHQKQVNPYLNAPDLNEFRERLKNLT